MIPVRLRRLWILGAVGYFTTALPVRAADYPGTVRPGDLFVIRTTAGESPLAAVEFLGKSYPPLRIPGALGAIFLLGVDLETPAGRQEIVIRFTDATTARKKITVRARRFPEERITLPPAMVTPPPEMEERIAREQEMAAAVYRASASDQLWERGFSPALDAKAAGNFGRRRILNGLARSPHAGQDYTAPAGTPVRAVGRGTVRLCRDFYYSGLTVLIDHGAGLVSQYLHLEKILVTEGAVVVEGEVIGRVGSTGRATGPHLHLGLRLYEQRVDPEELWVLLPGLLRDLQP